MRRRLWYGSALLAAWVLLAPLLANALIVTAPLERADAIIVLSGSATYDERLEHAIALYRAGHAGTLLLTDDGLRGGWSRARQANLRPVQHALDKLTAAGIPNDRITALPGIVHSTFDEAVALRRHLDTARLGSVLIVTSPYHSRRALWTMRRVLGTENVGVSSPPPGRQSPSPRMWWLSRRGWHTVGIEYLKIPYYFVRHR